MFASSEFDAKMGIGGAGARDGVDYWSDQENSGILKSTNKA